MDKTISLEFAYKSKIYYAYIHIKIDKQEKHYHITIMNGGLEKALYGNHIIIEEGSTFQSVMNVSKTDVGKLRQCIAVALYHHLQANGFPINLQEYSKLN